MNNLILHYRLILFVYLLLISHLASAQDKHKIIDVLNNQVILYENEYDELKNSKMNFYDEIDVEYPILKDLKDSLVQKKINKRIKNIIVNQIETDSFRVKLFINLKQNLDVFFAINGKTHDELGEYRINELKFAPNIKDISYSFLTYFKNIICINIDYKYDTQLSDYKVDEDFHYYETYYYNLSTGKEYRPKDVFNRLYQKELSEKIREYVKKEMENVAIDEIIPEEQYDSEVSNEKQTEVIEKTLTNFDINRAGIPYLKAFSFAYYIPTWSACSRNIGGLETEVRFTIEEIKKYLNPTGPFGFLIQTHLKESNIIKNQNTNQINHYISNYPQIFAFEFDSVSVTGNIKSITINKVIDKYIKDNVTEKQESLFKKINYQKDGVIKSVTSRNQTIQFDFNNNRQLLKKVYIDNNKVIRVEDFKYDKNGNLIFHANSPIDDVKEIRHFFYGDNFYIEENYNGAFENNYYKYSLDKNGLIVKKETISGAESSNYSESVFKYDQNNKLLLRYNPNENSLSGLVYVYDKNGNLLTYEYDSGRYLTEYKYDQNNNMILITQYDSKRVNSVKNIEYDIHKKPIKIEISGNSNSENQVYVVIYEYWE